ncbi:MAG: helix-turn-helix domain-containing protein [Gemmataceae bacterium]
MGVEMFGARLRELRIAAGLSQPALAEKAGLSKHGISDLEQGRRLPAWATVLALCSAFGIDPNAFTEEPANVPAPARGRPKKADGLVEPGPAERTGRGRPRGGKKRERKK